MKKQLRCGAAFIATLLIALLAFPAAVYADSAATVNGKAVSSGDTVTFSYYMGGVKDPLEAAGAYIQYDPKSLEYIDGSIGFDVFGNALYNIEEGNIYYSAINVVSGFDLNDEKLIVKLSFKVLDKAKGDLTITNTFDEIFTMTNEDVDLTEADYKARTETEVSDKFIGNDSPNRGLDANRLDEIEQSSETDIENFMLGTDKDELVNSMQSAAESVVSAAASAASKAEETASDNAADVKSAISSAAEKVESAAEVLTDDIAVESVASEIISEAVEEETVSEEDESTGIGTKGIVAVVAAVFVLLVIGVIVLSIVSKKKD